MANLSRFIPLEGVPDADARGAGTFLFDDGTSMVSEDPELAELVKSYQDTLPQLESQLPDQRLASNAPGFLPQNPLALDTSAPPSPLANNPLAMPAPAPGAPAAAPPAPAPTGSLGVTGVLDPAAAAASSSLAKQDRQWNRAVAPPPPAGAGGAGALPPPPSDASRAAELHRMAGQQALRGGYVAPREAGYSPAQRSGALPDDVAQRQADDRAKATGGLISATEQARALQVEQLRRTAMEEAMRISVQRAEHQRVQDEAEARRRRLIDERRRINEAEVEGEFGRGNVLGQAMMVLGAAMLGATGSQAGLNAIAQDIDRDLRKKMQVRGNKLEALAAELGDEEQAIAGAKAKLWGLLEREAANTGRLYDAAGIEHNTPAVIAEIKQRALAEDQEQERLSLGKTVETYHEARAGGRTGPNLDDAAKHYEKAAELNPAAGDLGLDELAADQRKDFVARMEGLSDAEHSLNEIDQFIGIQRDGAGNVANREQIEKKGIEGAGFFGGRTPDEFSSERGAGLSRETRRLIQAQVKASSGAAATDAERAEYGKNLPLVDEKDLLNSTTEERRKWHKNYAKAVELYGQDRVDRFLRGYRGTRGRINAQRGKAPPAQSARGRVVEIDTEENGE